MIASPARPEAVFCFEPPDDEREWYLHDFTGGSTTGQRDDNRQAYLLQSDLERRSSATVTQLDGILRPHADTGERELTRTIRGPWTSEFEVPER